jgi:hypothetical protein
MFRSRAALELNNAAERLTGWSERDAMDRDLSEVYHVLNPESRAISDSSVVGVVAGAPEETGSSKILVSRDGKRNTDRRDRYNHHQRSRFTTGVVLVFHKTSQ